MSISKCPCARGVATWGPGQRLANPLPQIREYGSPAVAPCSKTSVFIETQPCYPWKTTWRRCKAAQSPKSPDVWLLCFLKSEDTMLTISRAKNNQHSWFSLVNKNKYIFVMNTKCLGLCLALCNSLHNISSVSCIYDSSSGFDMAITEKLLF
jgi:hypothetical protein